MVIGIGAVLAGNISGAIENGGPFGQEFPGHQEIDRQILLAPAAAIEPILADAAISSRSVS